MNSFHRLQAKHTFFFANSSMRTLIGWHTFLIAISMNHGIEQKLHLNISSVYANSCLLCFKRSDSVESRCCCFCLVGGTQKYCIIWSDEIICIHRMAEVDTVEERLHTDPRPSYTHTHIYSLYQFIDQKQFFVHVVCARVRATTMLDMNLCLRSVQEDPLCAHLRK